MSFYFYDVETSGFNPRSARVMQFAGQRTDKNLKPIGKPDDFLIKMAADVLPDPEAVLVTGITPQQTIANGISEAQFLKYFFEKIVRPNTIFVGYNNIRFDDEFMRFMMWRNFYDAYEWHWKDSCSRWDLLDVVRMTRALRPTGIMWPFAPDGKPSNRLAFLSSVNKLEHETVHDALSDVRAAIAVANLIKNNQPKLFSYLLVSRNKTKVATLVEKGDPLLYTSGRYSSSYEKTTIAVMIAPIPDKRGALMYDLREEPQKFIKLTPSELAVRWQARGDEVPYFPIKILSYNRCPAIAPLNVLDSESKTRLQLDMESINNNLNLLMGAKNFGDKLLEALEIMHPKKQQELVTNEQQVDGQLYEGFVGSSDKAKMSVVRAAEAKQLSKSNLEFEDERLQLLLPLYKARNFPTNLSPDEQDWWNKYRETRLLEGGENSRAARYFSRITELGKQPGLSREGRSLLEELNLYGQSTIPTT